MATRIHKANDNRRVVIYVRISMDRDNQTSTSTQEKECREFATAKGWDVIDVAIDQGISAWSGKRRPGLERAMRQVETGKANAILVWKLDRFARSIVQFHELLGRINRANAIFASVTDQGMDQSTTAGQILLALTAGFAQMESDIKSERAAVWQKDRIAKGMPNGGQRTYGYEKQTNGSLPIIDSEAWILRDAARRILNGESLRNTLATLAPESVTGSGTMTARGLRSALTNPTVAGLRRSGDGYARGNWEPILPRDDWDALNALFGNPDRRTGTTNQIVHLLSGIMECGRCHSTVGVRKWKANPTKRNPYVQESHRYTCKCGNSIDAGAATDVVMRRMWEIVTPAQWREWRTAGTGWDQSVIDSIKARREKALMANVLGKISDEAYEEIDAECNRQESIATGEEPLDIPEVDDIKGAWDSLTVIDQRKVIDQAFQSITLNESNGCRNPEVRITTA